MDPRYAAHYRRLYEEHWWWRARERVILAELERLRPPGGFGPILDVGCGDGLFLPRLAAFGDPEGVEPDAALLTDAGRRSGRIHVGPFDRTFQPDRRYGLILLLDVIEHVTDDRACLGHALALLAPAGAVVVTVPAFRVLWTAHDDVNHHVTRYTRRGFLRLAAEVGLRVDRVRYLFQFTAAAKLAARGKEALLGARPGLPAIPPPWANRLLDAAARLEERTLGRLPVPFGSSLLVVGGR